MPDTTMPQQSVSARPIRACMLAYTFYETDGRVTFASGPDAKTYGVVDEIAGRALLTGARVLGVRKDDIPGRAHLAAILRYRV
ncbi:MAG: hypothetical protein HC869_11965 [Rhodospirillales bacterium]|nr:hypothetical protein [Rhodospirillales bacterium]